MVLAEGTDADDDLVPEVNLSSSTRKNFERGYSVCIPIRDQSLGLTSDTIVLVSLLGIFGLNACGRRHSLQKQLHHPIFLDDISLKLNVLSINVSSRRILEKKRTQIRDFMYKNDEFVQFALISVKQLVGVLTLDTQSILSVVKELQKRTRHFTASFIFFFQMISQSLLGLKSFM